MRQMKKIIQHERKTFINGKLIGKYVGYINQVDSDPSDYDVYDIEILSGEILLSEFHGNVQKYDEVDKAWKNQRKGHPIYNAKIPDNIPVKLSNINGETRTFELAIGEKQLKKVELSRQVYDGDKVYGDISAEISGFVTHYDHEEVTIIVPKKKGNDIPPFKTKERTGHTQKTKGLIRHQYKNSDNTRYWGKWQPQASEKSPDQGCLEVLYEIIYLILLALFIIPIIVYGWRILLPIALVLGIAYLLPYIGGIVFNIFRWFFHLASLAILLALGIGIFHLLMGLIERPTINPPLAQDEEEEITEIQYDPVMQDSLIVHHRIWQDYEGKEYEMDIKIRKSSYLSARNYRNSLSFPSTLGVDYNQMVNQLYRNDSGMLDLVYESLDSLKNEHNLNANEFAKVVVSMIQDIPYTLILSDGCTAYLYNDNWLRDYLNSGQACEGNVKYGILSPIEFLGSLNGDCDTRTLLLYTILSHYNYDVVMLKSDIYMHSILGVNMQSEGQTKVIDGTPYVLWETTAKNLPPGFIDQNM